MANKKFSEIADGGAVAGATDKTLAVRSGTTDVLVTPVALDLAQTFTAAQLFNTLKVATQTPASAAATGVTGTIAWDASFIYVCTATNTWKRVAIATW